MTRVVVLGDVMVDVLVRLGGPIAPGSDSPARVEFHGGGSAANVAAWLAAAGERPGTKRSAPAPRPVLVGRVGDDERGRAAVAELRGCGVDTRVGLDPERPTGTCVVLVGPDGERTMLPDAGANDGLGEGDLEDELLGAGRHLHVSGYALLRSGSRPAALRAIERARAEGMTVSVDPSSAALLTPGFLSFVRGIDLLLPNADELAALLGEAGGERAAARLAEDVEEVVVKLGARGALWTDGSRSLCVSAERVDSVVDSAGAGDAFAAGLLAARLDGAGPEEALAAGCRLAAQAVVTSGGRPPTG